MNGKFEVFQGLTVLLSYSINASVPLWEFVGRPSMGSMASNQARKKGVVILPSAFAAWVGQTVILQVAAGEFRVPLRGVIVSESDATLRFRIGECWDIEIFKSMILAVEEDNFPSMVMN